MKLQPKRLGFVDKFECNCSPPTSFLFGTLWPRHLHNQLHHQSDSYVLNCWKNNTFIYTTPRHWNREIYTTITLYGSWLAFFYQIFLSHATRHQMEIFSALLAICEGNPSASGGFPSQSQWRGALMFSLICTWTNGWANNRVTGDLRRHRAHYDVHIMTIAPCVCIRGHIVCCNNDTSVRFYSFSKCCLSLEVVSSIPAGSTIIYRFLCGFICVFLCQSIKIKPTNTYIASARA